MAYPVSGWRGFNLVDPSSTGVRLDRNLADLFKNEGTR